MIVLNHRNVMQKIRLQISQSMGQLLPSAFSSLFYTLYVNNINLCKHVTMYLLTQNIEKANIYRAIYSIKNAIKGTYLELFQQKWLWNLDGSCGQTRPFSFLQSLGSCQYSVFLLMAIPEQTAGLQRKWNIIQASLNSFSNALCKYSNIPNIDYTQVLCEVVTQCNRYAYRMGCTMHVIKGWEVVTWQACGQLSQCVISESYHYRETNILKCKESLICTR